RLHPAALLFPYTTLFRSKPSERLKGERPGQPMLSGLWIAAHHRASVRLAAGAGRLPGDQNGDRHPRQQRACHTTEQELPHTRVAISPEDPQIGSVLFHVTQE